jgi:hypothetical protein
MVEAVHAPGHSDGSNCCARVDGKSAHQTAKDPVSGMTVDPHTAKHRAEYGGRPWTKRNARRSPSPKASPGSMNRC